MDASSHSHLIFNIIQNSVLFTTWWTRTLSYHRLVSGLVLNHFQHLHISVIRRRWLDNTLDLTFRPFSFVHVRKTSGNTQNIFKIPRCLSSRRSSAMYGQTGTVDIPSGVGCSASAYQDCIRHPHCRGPSEYECRRSFA